MSAVSHAAPWYAVIDDDEHTEAKPYPTARDAMNRSAEVRGDGMGAASNVCDVRQRRSTTTTAETVDEYTGHAQRAATRDVTAAYPDARVVFLSLELRAGVHPALVIRWRVEHADGATAIVRLEDAAWVVEDEHGIRTGDALAPLTAVLA